MLEDIVQLGANANMTNRLMSRGGNWRSHRNSPRAPKLGNFEI